MSKKDKTQDTSSDESTQQRSRLRDLISAIGFALAVAAIIKELRTPKDERRWHGLVAGLVPYDFRPPTVERAKERLWNPAGPLLSSQVFGVGWTLNIGALIAMIRRGRIAR